MREHPTFRPELVVRGGLDGQIMILDGRVLRAEMTGEQALDAWILAKRAGAEALDRLNTIFGGDAA